MVNKGKRWFLGLVVVLVILGGSVWGTRSAWANVAPPEHASGADPVPDAPSTQVRMLAEQVVLTVAPDGRSAGVQGRYRLRNEGTQTETLAVRFPLSYLTDEGSSRPPCPEIRDLQVRVDGQPVPWVRQQGPPIAYCHEDGAPWAVFQVAFPPGQEVLVEIAYTQEAWGYEPYWTLSYIVATGAGWYGTIGQGEIQVVMPYTVSPANIVLDGGVGYGHTSPPPRLVGRSLIWAFTDLEPTEEDNIWVLYVEPALWADVEKWRAQTRLHPQDGDAWGFLGLALKRVLADPIGWEMGLGIRTDSGARALLREALDAYAQAVELKSEDPDWHFGYAELLVAAAYLHEADGNSAQAHAYKAEATRQLAEALHLDPNHEKARTFLQRYAHLLANWVTVQGDEFVFVGLTATPPGPTSDVAPFAPTATPTADIPASPTSTPPRPAATDVAFGETPSPGLEPAEFTSESSNAPWMVWGIMALISCGGFFLLVAAIAYRFIRTRSA